MARRSPTSSATVSTQSFGVTVTSWGNVVVAGSAMTAANQPGDVLAVRYRADGGLDRTLGGRGWVRHDLFGHWDRAFTLP